MRSRAVRMYPSVVSIRLRRFTSVAALLSAFSMSSECLAAPHARDGFYVQLTTGFGLPRFAITADDGSNVGPPDRYASSQSGVSTGGSLLLGVPLRPGLVLGVGGLVALSFTGRPNVTRNGQPWALVDVQEQSFLFTGVVGPFVDIYPSSTLGWHVQALAGYASVTYAQITQNPFSDGAPSGIGLMAGVGHDWWVSDHWSIGLLARLTYASMQLAQTPFSDGIGWVSEHNTLVLPSLEASFTAH